VTPSPRSFGASHSSRLAPKGNGATAGAVEILPTAPQARTAVPLQWSRHHGLQRVQGPPLSSGTLPHQRGEHSEPQFAPTAFGTVVRACASLRHGHTLRRTISWRGQVRGTETPGRPPTGVSRTPLTRWAAENSSRMEVGDLHRAQMAVFSWICPRCPRRIGVPSHGYRTSERTGPVQAAHSSAHHCDRAGASRLCRCARPHPVTRRFRRQPPISVESQRGPI
jgi:hypothetical protein